MLPNSNYIASCAGPRCEDDLRSDAASSRPKSLLTGSPSPGGCCLGPGPVREFMYPDLGLVQLGVKPPPAFGHDVHLVTVDADGRLVVDEVDREVRPGSDAGGPGVSALGERR